MLLITSIFWAVWLLVSPQPWGRPAAAILAAGSVMIATVAVAGIMLEHSRLAHKLAWASIGLVAVLALSRPVGIPWISGVALMGVAALALTSRTLEGWIRSEPPVAPIPKAAVGLAILLLWTPIVTVLVGVRTEASPLPWLSLACWLILFWYIRRLAGAVLVVRFVIPLLMLGGWWLPDPARPVWIAMLALSTELAWTAATRLAIRPLVERGTRVMIPPELLSTELRQALQVDPKDR